MEALDPIFVLPSNPQSAAPSNASETAASEVISPQPEPLSEDTTHLWKRSWSHRTPLLLGLGMMIGLVGYVVLHWSYYALPWDNRPLDPRHGALRPSGHHGLVFGMVGTIAMLLNLTYLLRKRLAAIKWLGSLRGWMGFHVLTGLIGPALIILHAAFAPTSALASLAFYAMLIVVVTGLVGRYIYTHVPRSYRGRELEIEEVQRRLAEYRQQLEILGIDAQALKVDAVSTPAPSKGSGVLTALCRLVVGDREARRQFHELQQQLGEQQLCPSGTKSIIRLIRKLSRERQWLLNYHELKGLMSSWRFLHRWLAVVLVLVVAFHIALALRFGGLWILR